MSPRAVLCDVYQTLLEVGPPPANAEDGWAALCRGFAPRLPTPMPPMNLAEFGRRTEAIIARDHVEARARGIAYPEVYWPAVVCDAVPVLRDLEPQALDDFLYRHAQLVRTVRLAPGAATALSALRGAGVLLGIASNAQPYTLRELAGALAGTGLSSELFVPELLFWSFAHGFSKPDPHVFRLLTARLRLRGVAPAEAIMVGDREDNDLSPARAAGWGAWQLTMAPAAGPDAGTWEQLRAGLGADRI